MSNRCATARRLFSSWGADVFKKIIPSQASKRVAVVISTGIHQNTMLYDGFARRLTSEGYPALIYDHRGFGRSPSYTGCERSMVPEWHDLHGPSVTGDLRNVVLFAKAELSVESVVVFGHSLGGLAAGLLATSGDNPADGFILSNPSLQNPWASAVDTLSTLAPTEWNGTFITASASNNKDVSAMGSEQPPQLALRQVP